MQYRLTVREVYAIVEIEFNTVKKKAKTVSIKGSNFHINIPYKQVDYLALTNLSLISLIFLNSYGFYQAKIIIIPTCTLNLLGVV